MTQVPIIQKPVRQFALQMNGFLYDMDFRHEWPNAVTNIFKKRYLKWFAGRLF